MKWNVRPPFGREALCLGRHLLRKLACLALAVGVLAPACKPTPPAIVDLVPAVPGAWLPESLELELDPGGRRVEWKRGGQVVLNDLTSPGTLAPTGNSWLGQPVIIAPGKVVQLRLLPIAPLDAELRPQAWPQGTSSVVLFVDLSLGAEIKLSWRDGLLVVERARCGPSPAELEAALGTQWQSRGRHRAFSDRHHDIAVLVVAPDARLADVEPFAAAVSRVQRSVGNAWGPAFDLRVARVGDVVLPKPTRGPTRAELERVTEPVAALPTDGLRVSGRIEPRVVLDALQGRARAITACASREPGKALELELRIVFGADGIVGDAWVREDGVESESATCVAAALREAPFPEPEGGRVTLSGKLRVAQSGAPLRPK